jgi:DNA-binding protein YbaB
MDETCMREPEDVPDAAHPPLDSIENLASLIAQQNAAVQEMQDELGELRGTARSADGRVTVEVDQRGVLTGLWIDPRAMRPGSDALAKAILATVRDAVRDADEKAGAVTRSRMGVLAEDLVTPDLAGREMEEVLVVLREMQDDLRI